MALSRVLTNLGLTPKEAKIYLAGLEIGSAPASDIALRAKMNRVSTYDILLRLKGRGLATAQNKKKVKYFTMLSPDLLREDFRKKYMDLKEALPDLRRLEGNTSHPYIRYYSGLEAVKKIYADSLSARTEILNYSDSKLLRESWPKYDKEYVDERVKKRIYLRGISPLDDYGKKVVAQNEKKFREIRLVQAGPFSFNNEINIYDDKVSIVSFSKSEIMGMIIESPEIANTQRAIFMMAWEFAGIQRPEDW